MEANAWSGPNIGEMLDALWIVCLTCPKDQLEYSHIEKLRKLAANIQNRLEQQRDNA